MVHLSGYKVKELRSTNTVKMHFFEIPVRVIWREMADACEIRAEGEWLEVFSPYYFFP